jgi:biopolymer transport protein ExbB
VQTVLAFAGYAIYALLALIALYGAFLVVVTIRRIGQKRFRNAAAADEFLDEVRERLEKRDYEAVAELCDTPDYWAKAVPQLILVALPSMKKPIERIREQMAETFERDVLTDFDYRTAWINTIVKAAPMIGLLGTVVGMILAFQQIAGASAAGIDPKILATDISFALNTTAAGLAVAIPLVLCGALIQVRIGKLTDAVEFDVQRFLADVEETREVRP